MAPSPALVSPSQIAAARRAGAHEAQGHCLATLRTAHRPPGSTGTVVRSPRPAARSQRSWRAPSAPDTSSPRGRRCGPDAPRPAPTPAARSPEPAAATPSSGCGRNAAPAPPARARSSTAAPTAASPAPPPTPSPHCAAIGSVAAPRPRPSATPSPGPCPARAVSPPGSACGRRSPHSSQKTSPPPPRSVTADRARTSTTAAAAPCQHGVPEGPRSEARAGGAPGPSSSPWPRAPVARGPPPVCRLADLALREASVKCACYPFVFSTFRPFLELRTKLPKSSWILFPSSNFRTSLQLRGSYE